MRSSAVVESFPFFEFLVQINIISVGQQLVELFFVGSVRSFDFAVELRRSRFDVDMASAFVFDVPVELSLELMATIRSDSVNAKREPLYDIIYEVNGIRLSMALVDPQSAYPGGVINDGVLISTDPPTFRVLECQEGHINLDVVARNPLGISTRMNGSTSDVSW